MEKSQEIRSSFYEADSKRDAGLQTPIDIKRFDNIPYAQGTEYECTKLLSQTFLPGQSSAQLLDVYRPGNIAGKLPVIVSIHGGGWVYGDKEIYQYYCMDLAKRGFAVINYNYRLAPEHKYPASLIDTNLVFVWIKEHAEEYGFDVNNVFALGDSAGAHLLSLYCDFVQNENYRALIDYVGTIGMVPKAIALNCGFYDFEAPSGDIVPLMDELLSQGKYTDYSIVSPITYMTKDFPPAYIMTCVGDFLREQPKNLIEIIDDFGIKYIYKEYGTNDNPLSHVFHCNIRLKEASKCNDEECEFFKSFIN